MSDKPRKDSGADGNERADGTADPALTLAKWLLPTAGVLFGLVGYVIDSAHRSLLAFPTDDGRFDSGGRLQDATDFFRFLVTLVADRSVALASFKSISLAGHGALLLGCALLLACVLGSRGLLSEQRPAMNKLAELLRKALPWALVFFVGLKFFAFDAPTMRIEGVIVGSGIADSAVAQEGASEAPMAASGATSVTLTESLISRLTRDNADLVGQYIAARAARLWRLMACARIGDDSLGADLSLAREAHCSRDDAVLSGAVARDLLGGEFDAGLCLAVLIAVAALALLSRRSLASTALALLGLAYLLTVPYAWGKLLKPVDFPYALVRAEAGIFMVPGPSAAQAVDAGKSYAFVLAREPGAVTLLHAVRESCTQGSSAALRFASIPPAKIVAIEQIYRLDVIEWALRSQRNCPTRDPGMPR